MKKSVSMPLPDWLSVNETEMKYHTKAHGLPLTPSVMRAYRRAEEKGTFTLRFPTYEQVKYGNRMPKRPQHGLRMMKPVGRTMRMGGKGMSFGGRTMRLGKPHTKSHLSSLRGKIKRLI
jgi:hypothetical protein